VDLTANVRAVDESSAKHRHLFGVNQFCPLAAIRLTVEKVEVDVA
jgi:hypothetical protein